MPNNSLSYPKVCKNANGKYYLDIKLNNRRHRLFSGRRIGNSININSYPNNYRKGIAIDLAEQVYKYLINNNYSFDKQLNALEFYDMLITKKLSEPLSNSYRKSLVSIASCLRTHLAKCGEIKSHYVDMLSLKYNNNTSYNTMRRHVNVIVNYLYDNGFPIERSKLKSRKQIETLHKPIGNLKELLEYIKSYNKNLYLCALLTYGCLLRPHQEIRCLKWRDFSDDLSLISLSGNKVKSKRNRVVPVPQYIRKDLVKGEVNNNIFTGTPKPYNNSYFKGIWRRFKGCFPSVERDITLYSFRHTGAIEIYKRTGSLSKLQKAMGHSSLKVSLTYLRGLEVEDLKEEDMPMV